jgi:hypothetical protein
MTMGKWFFAGRVGALLAVLVLAAMALPANADVPPPPTGVSATAGDGRVTLNWTVSAGATGYTVYQSTSSHTEASPAALTIHDGTATTGQVAGLSNGTRYYFVMQAINASGHSTTNSNEVSATPMAVIAPPPTNVTAVAGNGSVTLNWTAVAGATGYTIYKSTASHGEAAPAALVVGGGTSTTGTVTGLTNGTKYYFVMQSTNSAGHSTTNSNEASATPVLPVPAAPTNVTATAADSSVVLNWTASAGATSYTVYKSTASHGEAAPVALTVAGGASTTGTVTGLTNGTRYYFVMQAVNASGHSTTNSNEVTAIAGVPIPPPPTNVTATAADGSVVLNWTAAAGATSYTVYKSTTSHGETAPIALTVAGGATTTGTVTGLTNGTKYYFVMQSVNASGHSTTNSNEVSATPAVVTTQWIPDYYGERVRVRSSTTGGAGIVAGPSVDLQLQNCNPNSVAVNSGKLYVVCSNGFGNMDQILVYDAATIRSSMMLTNGTPPVSNAMPLKAITHSVTSTTETYNGQPITGPTGQPVAVPVGFYSLIAIAFDASNNLWVSSYGGTIPNNANNVSGNPDPIPVKGRIFSISAAELANATPAVVDSLDDSPSAPAGLVFDTDGSLWVVGQYANGILLNFTSDQLFNGANANPRYCFTSDNVGCSSQAGLFKGAEGVALFDNKIWVANNDTGANGDVPGRELVGMSVSNGQLVVGTVFGSSTDATKSPVVCPGGLFATSSHLWVNDESYGENPPHCGAAGDQGTNVGGIFAFTAAQLEGTTTDLSSALRYTQVTSLPGFGGIYIENDTP